MAFTPILAGENAFAQDETINITGGNIEITETGYSLGGGNETAHSNEYTIIQSSDGIVYNRIVIESGNIKMTISDIDIEASGGAAISVKNGATLELVLDGENTIRGDEGYAGISVEAYFDEEYEPEKSGKLIISGDGKLKAFGGNADGKNGGGAGIGGDGYGNNPYGGDFGVVEINGGNIYAEGGAATSLAFGAGAGIGGGGFGHEEGEPLIWTYAGRILIAGGTIEANGGESYGSFCGAAGIGSGAGNANGDAALGDSLETHISGGKVEAYGAVSAAGIGGGANGSYGSITIDGNAEVKACGKADEMFGGAGIGGGDNGGGLKTITIGGSADVEAYGAGGAAGIGGGNYGFVEKIIIKDQANVTAVGGSYITVGGAAIGSGNGYGYGYSGEEIHGELEFSSEDVIIAYGGSRANSIGGGSYPIEKWDCDVNIDKNTGEIWLFGFDNFKPALLGISDDNTIDTETLHLDSLTVHWHNASGNETNGKAHFWNGETIDGELYDWEKNDGKLSILLEGKETAAQEYVKENHPDSANWAVVLNEDFTTDEPDESDKDDPDDDEKPDEPGGKWSSDGYELDRKFTINYETNGGEEISSESLNKAWTKEFDDLPVPERIGYKFEGWYSDDELEICIMDDIRVNRTVTIYAGWVRADGPISPEETGVDKWLNTSGHAAYIKGYPDGELRPESNITRAEAAQMFYSLLKYKTEDVRSVFLDVPDDAWYSKAVRTLADMGIIDDKTDRFEPDRNITRGEFVEMAAGFAHRENTGNSIFTDVAEDNRFYESIMTAVYYGWISGYPDGTFRLDGELTRAEAVVIVNNMLGRFFDKEYIEERRLKPFTDLAETHWAYLHIMEASVSHAYYRAGGKEIWLAVL